MPADQITQPEEKAKVAVIGGGIAGVLSAIELAKYNKVVLFEKQSDLLMGTSKNQSYRLHTGLHYPDEEYYTSVHCLMDTIAFLQELPKDLPKEEECVYHQRSRYFLMSDSPYDIEHMRKLIDKLKQVYKKLCEQDDKNRVLGDPKNFITEVDPEDYESYVAEKVDFQKEDGERISSSVVFAVDIEEPLIKLNQFRQYIHNRIKYGGGDIKLYLDSELLSVKPCEDKFGYDIEVQAKGASKTFGFDGVVNCGWEKTESIHPAAYAKEFDTTNLINRAKVSILVKLPESAKKIPTSMFCYGPHAAIAIQENGIAVITFEPATNIGNWLANESPIKQAILDVLGKENDLKVDEGVGQKLTKAIIDGIARYMPSLKDVEPLEVRIGYVRMPVQPEEKDRFSLHSKESSIHHRRESGVQSQLHLFNSCYIVNEARKFTYGYANARQVGLLMAQKLALVKQWQGVFAMRGISLTESQSFREAIDLFNQQFSQMLMQMPQKVIEHIIPLLSSLDSARALMQEQLCSVQTQYDQIRNDQTQRDKITALISPEIGSYKSYTTAVSATLFPKSPVMLPPSMSSVGVDSINHRCS